jgi:hypothetical protein
LDSYLKRRSETLPDADFVKKRDTRWISACADGRFG